MSVLKRFYSALAQRDWIVMAGCYHPEARFSDPAFPDLDAAQVKAMWRMLITAGTDMRVTFRIVEESADRGVCAWEAFYTFSTSGRSVHNIICSEFELRDGLIYRQRDHFNFWRWSRQALGISGLLLGWSPIVKNKVRAGARARLERAMRSAQ